MIVNHKIYEHNNLKTFLNHQSGLEGGGGGVGEQEEPDSKGGRNSLGGGRREDKN